MMSTSPFLIPTSFKFLVSSADCKGFGGNPVNEKTYHNHEITKIVK